MPNCRLVVSTIGIFGTDGNGNDRVGVQWKETHFKSKQMKTNLIGKAYLAKIASDTQKKASECSRFSNEANEIGTESQQNNESTMQRIARMLGCDFLYPWGSIRRDRNEPSAFRQMIDCKMRQPKTEKSYFFPE